MSEIYKRTHMCGELRLADEGKEVILNGWVAKQRSLGSLVFVDLRDKTGITQITFNEDIPDPLSHLRCVDFQQGQWDCSRSDNKICLHLILPLFKPTTISCHKPAPHTNLYRI